MKSRIKDNNKIQFDMKNFINTNNVIIKVLWKEESKRENIDYYLVSKIDDQIYFYEGMEVLYEYTYTYDSDLTLKIFDGNKVIQELKKEKYFSFEEEHLFEKIAPGMNAFIKLPLPKSISIDDFQKKYSNATIILEAEIIEEAIEELMEKQKESIYYDASQLYSKLWEINLGLE